MSSMDSRPFEAVADAGEDALGGGDEGVGAAVALLDERLLAGLEGGVDLLAAVGDLVGELGEVAELAVELLELDHGLGEVFLGGVGGVGEVEEVGDTLAEELELGSELGGALGAGEVVAAAAQLDLGGVEGGVDHRDVVDDLGGLGGVVDLEVCRRCR